MSNTFSTKWNKGQRLSRLAFTLAEVLITLGIIGMVAEVTIPTVIKNVQKTQLEGSLKKFYTNFNQILTKISGDYGYVGNLKATGIFATGTTNNTTLGQALLPYFKVAKDCSVSTAGCWPTITNDEYDGTGTNQTSWHNDTTYHFITADGMSVMLSNTVTNCAAYAGAGTWGYLQQYCGYVYVDLNGFDPPNRMGVDTFAFYITNGKGPQLYPMGGADDTTNWWSSKNYCKGTAANDGYYCTGRVVEEGWKINY